MRVSYLLLVILITSAHPVLGQSGLNRDVRLFHSFFQDGALVGSLYGEGVLQFSDFDAANTTQVGARIGFPLGSSFELGTELYFLTVDPEPEVVDGRSGVTDLGVTGRYLVHDQNSQITVGGSITLPLGDEDIGEGDVDLAVFGAIRHPASPSLTILGTLGIEFLDRAEDYETSLRLGGGLIYDTDGAVNILGELTILSETDYAVLSGGIDYPLSSGTHLRGGIGVGLDDDGSPDLLLILSVLFM